MNVPYKFTFRRLWKRSFVVIGHSYFEPQDKMVLYFPDGSCREIKKWSNCEVHLGLDWVAATKDALNREAQRGI